MITEFFTNFKLWSVCLLPSNTFVTRIISSTLKMEAIHSSEMSVCIKPTQCHIPEDGILQSYCRENPKSYNYKFVLKREHFQLHQQWNTYEERMTTVCNSPTYMYRNECRVQIMKIFSFAFVHW
jgi:hypothetical protein